MRLSYSLSIERDRDGTTIKVEDSGLAGDDDPKFEQTMDFGDGRTMHIRVNSDDADGKVEEVVIVSTDIEVPRGVAFAKFENAAGTPTQALGVSTDTTNDDPDDTNEALDVGDTADARALVMSDAFVLGTGTMTVLTFDNDDTTTNNEDEAFETAGTYNGAMGTYRCNGTSACTVTLARAMGEVSITDMSGGWIFTPDAGATSDQPDYDYLRYGFWLMRTTDEDGVLEYDEVETFAGSSIDASGSVAAVTGSASYEGGAVGVYVHSVLNPDGTRASATSGHFEADASLKAYFGGDDIAVSNQNTVTGTIDNFQLSDHDTGPGWSVSLEQGEITENVGTFTGATKGGGADGSYSGTFHGPADADNQPHSAVGEFDANFSNGTVAGGFGARKED